MEVIEEIDNHFRNSKNQEMKHFKAKLLIYNKILYSINFKLLI